MRVKPYNTLILIEYNEEIEKVTKAGIYVPNTMDDEAFKFLRKGIVKEVNANCSDIMPGDTVFFDKRARYYLPNSDTLFLVRTEDIYGIIKEDGPVATI